MRISDWSSDVCSSDLVAAVDRPVRHRARGVGHGAILVPSQLPPLPLPLGLPRGAPQRQVDGLARGVADALRRDHPLALDHLAAALHPRFLGLGDAGLYRLRLCLVVAAPRSEEHTSELQSLMRISYA